MQRSIRFQTVEHLEAVARNAILGGYGTVLTWDEDRDKRFGGMVRRKVLLTCAMDCQEPHEYEMHARESAWHNRRVKPLSIVVQSRCRRCPACKRRRTLFWQARAVDEWIKSPRTIFGTLTTTPNFDMEVDALARISLAEKGVDFDRDLNAVEQFRARVRIGGLEVTKFLKRIREGDANRGRPRIRYLLVAEAHDGGRTSDTKRHRPHWHMLLHEQDKEGKLVLDHEWAVDPNGELRADKWGNPYLSNDSFLKSQWPHGHSSFALCSTPQAAGYLCKYLTKDETNVRIRASFLYGASHDQNASDAPGAMTTKAEKVEQPLNTGAEGTN